MLKRLFSKHRTPLTSLILLSLHLLPVVSLGGEGSQDADEPATEPPSTRIYRSPEERREAGLGTQVTDWMKVSWLLEFEAENVEDHYIGGNGSRDTETNTQTLQLGFDIKISEFLQLELLFEGENSDRFHSKMDEGIIDAELGKWGVKLGRQYLQFGAYYSHFITGPMLEFGETRADSLIVDYAITNTLEIAVFLLDSKVSKADNGNDFDWGIGLEYVSAKEAVRVGMGFLSDLAESDEQLLEDQGNTYQQRVPAWNIYSLVAMNDFELTAESVHANSTFKELESDSNQPSSHNLEIAYFPNPTTQIAVRMEYSRELQGQPKWQYGLGGTWFPNKNISLSMEYFYGEYKSGFVLDDDDRALDNRNLIAVRLAMEL